MMKFNVDHFIRKHITGRAESLFAEDLRANEDRLREETEGKDVLVIGGAGTIGSNYIKALLPYRPRSLTVVDYSENGLTELTRALRSSAPSAIAAGRDRKSTRLHSRHVTRASAVFCLKAQREQPSLTPAIS